MAMCFAHGLECSNTNELNQQQSALRSFETMDHPDVETVDFDLPFTLALQHTLHAKASPRPHDASGELRSRGIPCQRGEVQKGAPVSAGSAPIVTCNHGQPTKG